ncbi:heparinase II/III family protein [Undibacter mobilis]|uniref:Uncharacterized protein n=1 Tax=Undibacter mobilis TaxID=2292256 RepID=A0A371B6E7_9BRAD|nr:heparinase II/III family protein [Undibacter mobilis]RDV03134.1 hypothetical protein DXH78_00140 [Undibacter mobilis]
MDIRGYIRQVRSLPLDMTMRKAARLAARTARARMKLAADIVSGSYGGRQPNFNPAARIVLAAADVPSDLCRTLLALSARYLEHRFDLLGSGWVSPVYGFSAKGFLGHRYEPNGLAAPLRNGEGLETVVNRSNLAIASAIWGMIEQSSYVPIDWQVDVRSGYRWDGQRPSMSFGIPVDIGADIKVPWELARLQHLPQLALCALLAKAGAEGFETLQRYIDEIGDQIADFTATNPPRFGVNWVGTMDVAIRAANIALTRAILAGAGLSLPPNIDGLVAQTLGDHGDFIAEHLEYSEVGRSNHYLADLGGLLWIGWTLEGEAATRWLTFATAELLAEAEHQFLPDGGNYEGSTNYHRLSGEIVAFGLALIGSLDANDVARLDGAMAPERAWRALYPQLPLPRPGRGEGGMALVGPHVLRKLADAARLTRAIQGDDAMVVQIGDTDSGRFFKLTPTLFGDSASEPIENTLDHRAFPDMVDALSGGAQNETVEGAVVRSLLSDCAFAVPERTVSLADFGEPDAALKQWNEAPDGSKRLRHIELPRPVDPSTWTREAFPDFGLYVYRSGDLMVTFRCAGAPVEGAPRGHRHDDNLGVELRLGDYQRRDPGSFVYTPSVARRNAYRAAVAHDAPRPLGLTIATMKAGLFDLDESGFAHCLCWRPDTVAGELLWAGGSALRVIKFSHQDVRIYDCVTPGPIADVGPVLPVARGYGLI